MVTILLATYRGERFLPALTASLLAQTHMDFCVLWQDDGGDTPPLPADGRFVPGAHQGRGFGAARNFFDLLTQATGDVALCDQDDVWHRDKLERGLNALHQAEAAYGAETPLLVHSDCRLIDADGCVLQESFFSHQGWDANATALNRLIVQNNVTGCTVLMNEALRRLVCARLPDAPVLHDWWIALLAAAYGRVICLPEPLVDYRQHGDNVIGASRTGLFFRAASALKAPAKARARIRLTYDMARLMLSVCEGNLPTEARSCLTAYLATRDMPKMCRVLAVRKGGYAMQSLITQLGQIIFG